VPVLSLERCPAAGPGWPLTVARLGEDVRHEQGDRVDTAMTAATAHDMAASLTGLTGLTGPRATAAPDPGAGEALSEPLASL